MTNAFADYSFVWMTPAYQRYWKAENSENGVKDFKPGIVYYGMPYISGGADNRRYNWQKAVGENRYVYGGDGYYLLNQSRLLNGLYVGNDCSSFCNAANWGVTSSRIGDRTDDIFTSSYYKTVSLNNLRPGDMICLANRHVVFFLYYVDSAHTQIMILENGGAEAGVKAVGAPPPGRDRIRQADLAGIQPVTAARIDIARQGQRVPPPLAMLFSLPRGKARVIPAPNGAGWFVVYLDKVIPGDASKEAALISGVKGQFSEVVGNEYVDQLSAAIRGRTTVKRNAEAVQALRKQLSGGGQ